MTKILKGINLLLLWSCCLFVAAQSLQVTIKTAGTLGTLLTEQQQQTLQSLKINGPLNGSDFLVLRTMAGYALPQSPVKGKLTDLDLSEAQICQGGAAYFHEPAEIDEHETPRYTQDNVLGFHLFYGCQLLQRIVIPNSVTKIVGGAFDQCPTLRTIVAQPAQPYYLTTKGVLTDKAQMLLVACPAQQAGSYNVPQSVTAIDNYAFSGCRKLTAIQLPSGLTRLGEDAFANCSSLTQLNFPDGLSVIPEGCCYGCTALVDVHFPSALKTIGKYAFAACLHLKNIQLPEHTGRICDFAFSNCKRMENITLPGELGIIDEGAFEGCSSLGTVVLPYAVTTLPDGVFADCTQLQNVQLPTNLTQLGQGWEDGEGVFQNCISLNNIVIPAAVTSLAARAFSGCTNLTSITVNAVMPPQCDPTALIGVPTRCTISVPQESLDAYQQALQWNKFNFVVH